MPKTALDRLGEKKEPKKVMLDKDVAGLKQGQMLFVATPQIVADYIRKIPEGETRTVERMRRELARRRGCDGSCPMSTAIFVRVAAEAALEEMQSGKPASETIPFWRIISGGDKIAKKLPIDPNWIDDRRSAEAT